MAATAATGLPARRRLVETAEGDSADAYGAPEWGLLAFTASVWGSSFLWMDIGLDAFAPGVITFARIALGAVALALFPRARRPLPRDDWPRVALLGVVWMGIPLTLFPIAQQWVDSSLTGMINSGVSISGLQQNEQIRGIDFRPADGGLYALGSFNNLYRLNANSGAASRSAPSAFVTSAAVFVSMRTVSECSHIFAPRSTWKSTESESIRHFLTLYRVSKTLLDTI